MPSCNSNQLADVERVRFLATTFRHIHLVVFLIFVFSVVQMLTLWQVCQSGMKTADSLEHQGLPALNELASLQEHLALYRLDSYEYLFAQEAQKAGEAKAADDIALQMHAELKNIQKLFPEGEGRRLAANLEKAVDALDSQFQKVRGLVDADFPAAMKSMDQDIPPRTELVDAAANALKKFGYQFSGAQADATFASFGWIKSTAVMFGIANSLIVFCAFMFVLLAARRSRAQLSETLARLDERTQELQQTNGALALQKTELRLLFDIMPAMVWFKDTENNIVRVNQKVAEAAGKSVAELEGKSILEIYPQEAAKYYADDLEVIHSRKPKMGIVETFRDRDGNEVWVQTDKVPVFDENGKVAGIVVLAQDITGRRSAEENVRRLAAIVENSDEAIIGETLEGIITSWNHAAEKMFGHTAAEIIGQPLQLIIPPEQQSEESEILSGFDRGEQVCRFETIRLRKDGRHFDVSVTISPIKDTNGKIIGASKIVRDITERKLAENVLRESEERFSSAFELAPIGMALVAPDGRWVKVNRAICAIVGYSEAELLAGTFQEITHPDDLAADLECVRRLLAAEIRFYQMEKRYIHARGHFVTVLLDVSLIRDGRNQPLYFIAQIQDITERKRDEESLRLLGSAIEQSKESIIITDAQVNMPGPKILFVNRAFTQMTGYAAAEVFGKTPRMFQGPRTDKAVLKRLRKNLEDGEMFAGEAINYRKDGKEYDLEWQIAPIRDAGGKITHFVGIERDITGRKKLEEQLVQSRKMETVGKLAGGIAHEFNSILTAIIGQSELLLGDLPIGSPLIQNATEITKAANRAATLTRQLLAYGRKQFLQPEIINLNQIIAGMESMFLNLMGGDVGVQIVPARDLRVVKADAGQIEQVIVNLVINARDAMPNGGKLTLETANVSFDAESVDRYPELKSGDYVMIAISDTGMGMSETVRARVFEPFFSTKAVGDGTGLGLSTCYGIIKQSGGHISVYSEQGRGTTFKIYLPQIETRTENSVQRVAGLDLPHGTETILLVEDDQALREMAATLLRRLGYTVFAASNGVEALSLKHERSTGHIDLLFTDVVMPHMSGKELADRVRALYPHTKILFTSAYTENAIVHQGVLDKGVALLQKPFTPSALANKVREVLNPTGARL
jgi:PAS domain S-box-containing protein